MVNDSISNLIIKIKNASNAGKENISFPYSKYVGSILEVLKKEGFIKSYELKGKKTVKSVDIELAYEKDGSPKVSGVERVSKFSRRVYQGSKELRPVKNNYGILVLTTSKGILTNSEAKKQKVGGEALFKMW